MKKLSLLDWKEDFSKTEEEFQYKSAVGVNKSNNAFSVNSWKNKYHSKTLKKQKSKDRFKSSFSGSTGPVTSTIFQGPNRFSSGNSGKNPLIEKLSTQQSAFSKLDEDNFKFARVRGNAAGRGIGDIQRALAPDNASALFSLRNIPDPKRSRSRGSDVISEIKYGPKLPGNNRKSPLLLPTVSPSAMADSMSDQPSFPAVLKNEAIRNAKDSRKSPIRFSSALMDSNKQTQKVMGKTESVTRRTQSLINRTSLIASMSESDKNEASKFAIDDWKNKSHNSLSGKVFQKLYPEKYRDLQRNALKKDNIGAAMFLSAKEGNTEVFNASAKVANSRIYNPGKLSMSMPTRLGANLAGSAAKGAYSAGSAVTRATLGVSIGQLGFAGAAIGGAGLLALNALGVSPGEAASGARQAHQAIRQMSKPTYGYSELGQSVQGLSFGMHNRRTR